MSDSIITGIRVCVGLNTKWYAILTPAIVYFDRYPASHSWIEIDYHGQTWVYESVFPRSRRVTKAYHASIYKTVKMWELPIRHKPVSITHYLEERKYVKYSLMQLVIILLGILYKPFNIYFEQMGLNESKHLICTELCAYFLRDLYDVEFRESLDTIGLRDLDYAVRQVGKEVF